MKNLYGRDEQRAVKRKLTFSILGNALGNLYFYLQCHKTHSICSSNNLSVTTWIKHYYVCCRDQEKELEGQKPCPKLLSPGIMLPPRF